MLAPKAWLEQHLARVSGKAPIADVIRYALHPQDGLLVSPTMASNSVESTTGAAAVGREA
jgi:hypothetical protein